MGDRCSISQSKNCIFTAIIVRYPQWRRNDVTFYATAAGFQLCVLMTSFFLSIKKTFLVSATEIFGKSPISEI